MRLASLACSALALAALAACGGGGGGGGGSAGAPAPAPVDLLSKPAVRAMPDYLVTVALANRPAAGGAATVGVRLDGAFAAVGAVTSVSLCCGDAPEAGYHVARKGADGLWTVEVPVPATLTAATRVWLRIAHADGSEVASGFDDFALSAL